ncbi:MAG: hypothetical protein Q9200_004080 [Gallowayella weberi]
MRRNSGAARLAISALTATLLVLPVFTTASSQHDQLHRKLSHEAGPPRHRHEPSRQVPVHQHQHLPDHSKHKHLREILPTPEKASAIATTVAPAGDDRAVRAARPARGSGSSAGISSPHIARSLQDWEVEDFILLATVDGSIHARDRKTGKARWELQVDKPMVETIYHPKNDSLLDPAQLDHDFLWIVEPSKDGDIYIYNQGRNGGLQRLHMTVKQLVEDHSPYESVDPAVVYNAEKKTRLYTVDAATGSITKNFGSGATFSKDDESCPRNPAFAGLDEEECESMGSFVLGRTEYTISIQNRDTAEPICTLMYSEWGPNTRDRDLHSQYSVTMDNRYVYSLHDGSIFGWDHGQMLERQRSYTQKLSSPVVRVFDVARPLHVEEKNPQLIILPQPVGPIDKENLYNSFANQNRIFVNHTAAGGWFAMSETTYPLVTGRAKTAQCYDPEWLDVIFSERPMSLSQRQESFVGVHSLATMEKWRGSGLTISGPTSEVLDQTPASNNAVTAPLQSVSSIGQSRIVKGASENAIDIGIVVVFFVIGIFVYVNRRTISKFLRRLEINPDIPVMERPTASVPSSPMIAEAPWTEEPPQGAMEKIEETLESQDEQHTPMLGTRQSTLLEPPGLARSRSNSMDEDRGRMEEQRGVRFQELSPGPKEDEYTNPPRPDKKKARRGVRGGKNRKKRSNSTNDRKDPIEQTGENNLQATPETQVEPKVLHISNGTVNDLTELSAGTVQIGHLKVFTDTVLGHGSHGTVVYKGSFGSRDVAVKRMLSNFFEIAAHEVGLLQESDDHPNVIRYYDKEVTGDFLYIALELCPASLQDVVERPADFPNLVGSERLDPISVLKQIASGLQHLHSVKIVHRDIKPQNILVAAPKLLPINPTASQPARLLISDFGLCKKLDDDQNSFRATTAHAAGTSGWRAPELLVDEDLLPNANSAVQKNPLKPPQQAVSNNSEPLIVDPSTNRRATRAIDIFSLGCVFYYVLTNGCHPYDKDGKFMREANIVKGLHDISALDILGDYQWEAKDLIASMLDHNPRARPDAASVLTHPFFWPAAERLEFLCHVSDAFEFEPRDPPSEALEQLESYRTIIMAEAPKGDFLLALPREFKDTLSKQRKYTGDRVLDLLRALRNKKHHYEDIPAHVKDKIGSFPVGYLEFWARRFPTLLMATWRCVAEVGWADKERFKRYYEGL